MARARGATRGTARKGDLRTVKVTIDAARKKRFDALIDEMRSSKRDEASGFDAYWEAVDSILQGELYIAGGFSTADAFVRKIVKAPMRSALRNVRIARHASPAEEATFGTALLDAAIAYVEAKAGGPIDGPLPVAFDKLRIPVENGQSTKSVPLADATVEQVRAATRSLLGTSKKTASKRSPTEQAIATALHTTSALRSVTLSVRDEKVRIGPFPLQCLSDLGRALLQVKLPPTDSAAPRAARKKPVAPPEQAKSKRSKPKTSPSAAKKP